MGKLFITQNILQLSKAINTKFCLSCQFHTLETADVGTLKLYDTKGKLIKTQHIRSSDILEYEGSPYISVYADLVPKENVKVEFSSDGYESGDYVLEYEDIKYAQGEAGDVRTKLQIKFSVKKPYYIFYFAGEYDNACDVYCTIGNKSYNMTMNVEQDTYGCYIKFPYTESLYGDCSTYNERMLYYDEEDNERETNEGWDFTLTIDDNGTVTGTVPKFTAIGYAAIDVR